eukprot:752568-Hanusia_phi.AAC.2
MRSWRFGMWNGNPIKPGKQHAMKQVEDESSVVTSGERRSRDVCVHVHEVRWGGGCGRDRRGREGGRGRSLAGLPA